MKEKDALTAQVRAALTEIKPDKDAKKRMYQNILKKAEAQRKLPAASDAAAAKEPQRPADAEAAAATAVQDTAPDLVPIRSKSSRSWRRYLSLAACLLLVITAGFSLPKWLDPGDSILPGSDTELQDPPTLTASPYEDVEKPEDFAQLGFVIDAPADASGITYCIAYSTTAQVDFTMDEHRYTYLAAKKAENISGIYGDVRESQTLTVQNAAGTEITATLEKIQISRQEAAGAGDTAASADIWRASWQTADVTYCLLNEDGAKQDAVAALIRILAAQS